MPLTGPAAAGYSKIAPATKAYFDYVNANGGVHGRKITYKIMDDGYNPANTQKVVRKLVLQDKVFAILNGLGTPTHTGVLDFLKTNRVPDLFVASGSRSWNQPDKYPGTFGFKPDYTVEGKILGHLRQDEPRRQEGLLLRPGRRLRPGQPGRRREGPRRGRRRGQADLRHHQHQRRARRSARSRRPAARSSCSPPCPASPRWPWAPPRKLGFKPQWVVSSVGADHPTLAKQLGAGRAAARGPARRQLPADRDRRGQPVDPALQEDQHGVQRRTPRSTATPSTACPSATSSCRRCSRPARTSPAPRSSRRSARAAHRARAGPAALLRHRPLRLRRRSAGPGRGRRADPLRADLRHRRLRRPTDRIHRSAGHPAGRCDPGGGLTDGPASPAVAGAGTGSLRALRTSA